MRCGLPIVTQLGKLEEMIFAGVREAGGRAGVERLAQGAERRTRIAETARPNPLRQPREKPLKRCFS
jgi:hypothetical protein